MSENIHSRVFLQARAARSGRRTAGARTAGTCELINSRKEKLETKTAMRPTFALLLMAAATITASAQTAAKPAAPSATAPKAVATAAKPGTTAAATGIKLPPGIPPVKGPRKTAFVLQYQDIKIGTGPDAEPGKLYKVLYTGWRAADGVKFDASADHRQPLRDKDGKPIMGEDGKPKLDVEQPMPFPQGMGRVIPGFDQGFGGMKVGGKRRLFIPWQLAYGIRAIPDRPDHPGIPAKSDLIFDLELVDVSEMPAAPMHPGMGGMNGAPGHGAPMPPNHPGAPATPGAPTAVPTPNAAPAAAKPATPAAPSTPGTPATAPAPAAPATPVTPAAPSSK